MLLRGLIFIIPNALAESLVRFGGDQGGNAQKIVTSADCAHLSTAHPSLFLLSSFVPGMTLNSVPAVAVDRRW